MREVRVAWDRAVGFRVPIVEGRGFEFGERVVTQGDRGAVFGFVGWDPSLGWVMVTPDGSAGHPDEVVADRAHDADVETGHRSA